jgi:hypothetical protein
MKIVDIIICLKPESLPDLALNRCLRISESATLTRESLLSSHCSTGDRRTFSVFCIRRKREHACTYLTEIVFENKVTLGRVSE